MIDMSQKPIVNRHVRLQWEPSQSSYVLLYPEGMVKLNVSASEILRECNGEHTVADICHTLQSRYPEAGSLHQDVCDFFSGAGDKGWTDFV
ncbi:pyrroloquinoline quinone biosynthesis peptide chaperone PqqD [Spongiibacter nanhainus]|uniref:PqqA binding protein n=1 Tax=Spongiibacter nanhainus TaxID=2794344 RepID=A0A7T4UPT9_9GAMM|nr:pyrroloquinoline quinone biosynthesis peptide chaperone PqqD [Spongiibacter nanhainus]QQD17887.1 pyrroloquinoline quinone biosynthesis peptide chaperone PqqD [Spongiibacter nanhainus]